ncbi:hypothetical protein BJ508DRAFT_409894, partial [Ascobolus immersus RN42]
MACTTRATGVEDERGGGYDYWIGLEGSWSLFGDRAGWFCGIGWVRCVFTIWRYSHFLRALNGIFVFVWSFPFCGFLSLNGGDCTAELKEVLREESFSVVGKYSWRIRMSGLAWY